MISRLSPGDNAGFQVAPPPGHLKDIKERNAYENTGCDETKTLLIDYDLSLCFWRIKERRIISYLICRITWDRRESSKGIHFRFRSSGHILNIFFTPTRLFHLLLFFFHYVFFIILFDLICSFFFYWGGNDVNLENAKNINKFDITTTTTTTIHWTLACLNEEQYLTLIKKRNENYWKMGVVK